ncbi:MAG: hypothetical protein ABI311_11880 [Gemmatimonadaceae bacterium]
MAGVLLTAATQSKPAQAQASGLPSGTVRGVVTATTMSGDTVGASNVQVTLWTIDATTEATRDSACTAWQADKNTWLQARDEIATPSGIDWTGTKMAKDVNLLTTLMALRRDTTRTNDNGEFVFENVPLGAYTIEAETFATNQFLQWSRDVASIPNVVTMVRLDPASLAANQYCSMAVSAKGSTESGIPPDNSGRPNRIPGPRK